MFRHFTIHQNRKLEIILISILFLLVLMLAASCKHQPPAVPEPTTEETSGNTGNNGGDPVPCNPNTVYFTNTILPLFISNCAKSGCHDAASHQEDIILDSYANIMASGEIEPGNAGEGDIPEVITENDPDKIMPPPPNASLTSEQINLIMTWINQGAQNNYCDDCDTLNVTYATKVKPIIDLKCKGCHSGSNPPLGIDLTTYSGLQSIALTGSLMGAITHQPGYSAMPKNSPSLPQCDIDKIRIWVNNGAINN